MVYKEPQIKTFVSIVTNIFSKTSDIASGMIYFIKYNSKLSESIPEEIYNFYKTDVDNHIDGSIIYMPSKNNNKRCIVLYGKDSKKAISSDFGAEICSKIDDANWHIFPCIGKLKLYEFILGWALGEYNFKNKNILKTISIPNNIDKKLLVAKLAGIFYGKELINIPSSDMGPDAFEKSFNGFASYHNVNSKVIKGKEILEGFPLIYAVGKASVEEPRLLELNWGSKNHPSIILIGKGVCFDTGGLDLKPSQYMRNMKKDMGGAASILSLAHVIIESKLKINLKIL